jgi:polar amino acid transport system substrate-binding protein
MTTNYKKRISISISIIFIVLISGVAWYALNLIDKQTRNTARDALQTVLITTQEALHLWINQRSFDVIDIAQNGQVIQQTTDLLQAEKRTGSNQSLTAIRNLMLPRLSRYGDRDFLIIAPDRTNIASMYDDRVGQINVIQQQRKEYLDSVFNGATVFIPTIWSDTFNIKTGISAKKQIPAIFIASPIKNFEGKIIAALAIKFNLRRHFTRITQLSRIGQTGETYAFDEHATLISESRFDDQLRRIGLVGSDSRGILSIRVADPGGNLLQGYIPAIEADKLPLTLMASRATKGQSGHNTHGYRDYRGVEVFGVWLWDRELGFGLTTEVDADEAMQPFYTTRLAVILIAVLAILLCSILLSIYYMSED